MPVRASRARTSSAGVCARSALPTPVEWGSTRRADLGEHPHRVLRRHLGDVHDLVPVEQRHVRRLAGLLDQALEVGPRPGAQQAGRGLAEADQAGAQRVTPVGLLAHVAADDQRAHQPVDGREREPAARGELTEPDLAPGVGHPLQQIEGALEGLHAAAGTGGPGVGCAGVGRRHVNGPFEAEARQQPTGPFPIGPLLPVRRPCRSGPVLSWCRRSGPRSVRSAVVPLLAHSTFRLSKMNFYFVEISNRVISCSAGRPTGKEGS